MPAAELNAVVTLVNRLSPWLMILEDMAALVAREGFREPLEAAPGQVHIERYWQKETRSTVPG